MGQLRHLLPSALTRALAVAVALTVVGCSSRAPDLPKDPKTTDNTSESSGSSGTDASPYESVPLSRDQVGQIASRNIFDPLASEAREKRPEPSTDSSKSTPPKPSEPPDPVADIALTGIVELGGQLTVLVENTETGAGDFAAIDEQLLGFAIGAIRSGEVDLRGPDGTTHTIKFGDKEIADTAEAPTAKTTGTAEKKTETTPQSGVGPGGSFGRRRFDPGRYRQWLETLSPERRAMMEQRMRERRGRMGGR